MRVQVRADGFSSWWWPSLGRAGAVPAACPQCRTIRALLIEGPRPDRQPRIVPVGITRARGHIASGRARVLRLTVPATHRYRPRPVRSRVAKLGAAVMIAASVAQSRSESPPAPAPEVAQTTTIKG